MGIEEPGLNRVIRSGYELLTLQTYFTAGVKEVRAWTIPVGATAPGCERITPTSEKGFIRAEVVGYDISSNLAVKAEPKMQGKWRLEGKNTSLKMACCSLPFQRLITNKHLTKRPVNSPAFLFSLFLKSFLSKPNFLYISVFEPIFC
ncbi:DUF933 domain-containing protein [Vibrio lentus]|nr:DUF933 domain-containing protein [Vibrio lentus]